ncbi:hypothetical protein K443DRAFT_6773 [Laccaria amethystina LaAM-08-1]|uniref:Uncharacterized protein n=1 Tax=Laccaria amethystina LaAM-08-1 TaxID=1095629 RepID=A0A0C9X9C6_9AGAR|nr:hypothetical protein K443DRAFT_6773 [Laccaria amethystina LaAM-08-1]
MPDTPINSNVDGHVRFRLTESLESKLTGRPTTRQMAVTFPNMKLMKPLKISSNRGERVRARSHDLPCVMSRCKLLPPIVGFQLPSLPDTKVMKQNPSLDVGLSSRTRLLESWGPQTFTLTSPPSSSD